MQPPALLPDDERHPRNQIKYRKLNTSILPATESLKDTFERTFPYFIDAIAPLASEGKEVLITAHGNTLRALCKHLDNLSEQEVIDLNIPVGQPLVYELDPQLRPIKHYYLDIPEEIAEGVQDQIDMGKADRYPLH